MGFVVKSFEELSKDELYDIMKLRIEVFVIEQECFYQDCDGKDKESYHVFNYDGGELVAYARVINRGISYDEVSIGRVIVKENARGGGLAKDLMNSCIKFITEDMGESKVRISAQLYLKEFYSSLGFEAVSEVYLEDDIEHIEMLLIK